MATSPRTSMTLVILVLRRVRDPQNKVDHDRKKQNNGQKRRAEAVIEAGLAPHSYRLGSPVVCYERIYHRGHCDPRKQEGRDEGGAVAKVEHADRQGAEDDGEVEP